MECKKCGGADFENKEDVTYFCLVAELLSVPLCFDCRCDWNSFIVSNQFKKDWYRSALMLASFDSTGVVPFAGPHNEDQSEALDKLVGNYFRQMNALFKIAKDWLKT